MLDMAWLLLIYFVGAGITFLLIYTIFAKKYVKEKSALKFEYWLDPYIGHIILMCIFWVVVLPVMVALSPILMGIKLINKHYGIKQ